MSNDFATEVTPPYPFDASHARVSLKGSQSELLMSSSIFFITVDDTDCENFCVSFSAVFIGTYPPAPSGVAEPLPLIIASMPSTISPKPEKRLAMVISTGYLSASLA